MQVYGSGQGDAHPPEPTVFEYEILDRRGRKASWLVKYLTDADDERLLREFHLALESQ